MAKLIRSDGAQEKTDMDILRLTQHIRLGLTPLPFGTLLAWVATPYMLGTSGAIDFGASYFGPKGQTQ